MVTRLQTISKLVPRSSFSPTRAGLLQRKCACGESAGLDGECEECRHKHLQRRSANGSMVHTVPPIVHEVLGLPGQPLDPATRAFMEPLFRHDFSKVRIHSDSQAAESAKAVNALAYTIGRDVVFGPSQYNPDTLEGKKILIHELTHVVQQGDGETFASSPEPLISPIENGGYRIAVSPNIHEIDDLEGQADAVAHQFVASGDQSARSTIGDKFQFDKKAQLGIQRLRMPLPNPVPLCGRSLTHIDIEPPRWRPLVPCLPPTVSVYRINIVGREVSSRTTGRGRIIFNLHIGFFPDPATAHLDPTRRRWCGVIDDSTTCIAPRCLIVCFPSLREVIDWILDFIKEALKIIGIILLIILLALLGRWLIRTGPSPAPAPVPVIAAGGREEPEAATEEAEV